MLKFNEAKKLNRWSIDGLVGEFEKITKGEAKQLGAEKTVLPAIYGDQCIGYFVLVFGDEPDRITQT